MKLLSLDTSCKTAMVSVSEDGVILASVMLQDQKTHSVKMLPAVRYALSAAGTEPSALDLIAVTNGPGSYTGLRIGVTTAKTFGYSLQKPVIGISSLEALAASSDLSGDVPVCPLIDARNTRVYAAVYRGGRALIAPRACSCEELCSLLLTELPGTAVLFTGDGMTANASLLQAQMGTQYRAVPSELACGTPAAIALLAARNYAALRDAGRLEELAPEKLKVNYYKNYTDTI